MIFLFNKWLLFRMYISVSLIMSKGHMESQQKDAYARNTKCYAYSPLLQCHQVNYPPLELVRDALLEAKYPWCFRKQGSKCGFQSRTASLVGHIPGKIFQRCDAGECVWSLSEYVSTDFFFFFLQIFLISLSLPLFLFLILLVCLMLSTGFLVSFPISPTLHPCLWQPPVCSLYL